jgi:predicted XRE-type DNA-binding protein
MKVQEFESVWDAIEETPALAANMKARSDVMIAIQKVVESWNLIQADAARKLSITQPRLNDLLRGRIQKFSLEALMALAGNAGLVVKVDVRKRAA